LTKILSWPTKSKCWLKIEISIKSGNLDQNTQLASKARKPTKSKFSLQIEIAMNSGDFVQKILSWPLRPEIIYQMASKGPNIKFGLKIKLNRTTNFLINLLKHSATNENRL